MFPTLEGLGEGLHTFVELQKQRNNVQGFDLLWALKLTHQHIYHNMKTSQNIPCMWLGNNVFNFSIVNYLWPNKFNIDLILHGNYVHAY
jgi:hypothetical protein